jgi:hypothetical protein
LQNPAIFVFEFSAVSLEHLELTHFQQCFTLPKLQKLVNVLAIAVEQKNTATEQENQLKAVTDRHYGLELIPEMCVDHLCLLSLEIKSEHSQWLQVFTVDDKAT